MVMLLRRAPGRVRQITHARLLASASKSAPLLLSPGQLSQLLGKHKISLLDASWVMPNSPRNPSKEHVAKRIPGAQFLDLDQVASLHPLGLKHMMPSEQQFAEACEKFGIDPFSHVVIYDTAGIFSSPRALFMFRSFGHDNSSVLDGGLPAWIAQGLPVESGPLFTPPSVSYPPPKFDHRTVTNYEQIVANSHLNTDEDSKVSLVLDARSSGRFSGTEAEPRPGLPSGHIPHSFSLPFNFFLRKHVGPDGTDFTTFLPREDIHKALVNAVGPDRTQRIISNATSVTTTCGSGMTAAILWLGLRLIGAKSISLYDESWTGYAMRSASTINKAS